MENSVKWYSTTAGKVGIGVAIVAVITGIVVAYKRYTAISPTAEPEKLHEQPTTITPAKEHIDLPTGGKQSDVKTGFDRFYDYIKVNGIWWTVSKDRSKIPTWKSLADNKTASDLLTNKYPA